MTNNKNTLDPKNIYLDSCSIYNQIMENKFATKVNQPKNEFYG